MSAQALRRCPVKLGTGEFLPVLVSKMFVQLCTGEGGCACVHTGPLTYARWGAGVCDLIKRRILAHFFLNCLPPNSRARHLDGAFEGHQSGRLWLPVAPVSALPGLPYFLHPLVLVYLGWDAARDVLIHDPQRVGAAELHQRRVNLRVSRLHCNCDKLSLGNSLSAWEKALLPFNRRKVMVEFLSGDQGKKKSDWGRHVILPSRRSQAPAFIMVTGDIEMKFLQNMRPALRTNGMKPFVKFFCERRSIYFSRFWE